VWCNGEFGVPRRMEVLGWSTRQLVPPAAERHQFRQNRWREAGVLCGSRYGNACGGRRAIVGGTLSGGRTLSPAVQPAVEVAGVAARPVSEAAWRSEVLSTSPRQN